MGGGQKFKMKKYVESNVANFHIILKRSDVQTVHRDYAQLLLLFSKTDYLPQSSTACTFIVINWLEYVLSNRKVAVFDVTLSLL